MDIGLQCPESVGDEPGTETETSSHARRQPHLPSPAELAPFSRAAEGRSDTKACPAKRGAVTCFCANHESRKPDRCALLALPPPPASAARPRSLHSTPPLEKTVSTPQKQWGASVEDGRDQHWQAAWTGGLRVRTSTASVSSNTGSVIGLDVPDPTRATLKQRYEMQRDGGRGGRGVTKRKTKTGLVTPTSRIPVWAGHTRQRCCRMLFGGRSRGRRTLEVFSEWLPRAGLSLATAEVPFPRCPAPPPFLYPMLPLLFPASPCGRLCPTCRQNASLSSVRQEGASRRLTGEADGGRLTTGLLAMPAGVCTGQGGRRVLLALRGRRRRWRGDVVV